MPKQRFLSPEDAQDGAGCRTRDERVRFVFGLMRGFRFPPEATGELAELWGLTAEGLMEIQAEARGIMRGLMSSDKEEARSILLQRLEFIGEQAMAKRKYIVVKVSRDEETVEAVPDPDIKSAISSMTLAKDLLGLEKRTEDELDPEEVLNKLLGKRDQIAQLIGKGENVKDSDDAASVAAANAGTRVADVTGHRAARSASKE